MTLFLGCCAENASAVAHQSFAVRQEEGGMAAFGEWDLVFRLSEGG